MKDLSYFNLGFRSDHIFSQLQRAQNAREIEPSSIAEALRIVNEFLEFGREKTSSSQFILNSTKNISALAPILWDVYPELSPEDVISKLKTIISAFSQLVETDSGLVNFEVDKLEEAGLFFSRLADVCLSKSATDITLNGFTLQ